MPRNILIVPDKFKGTLTADQAAMAIACGWREVRPRDSLDLLPMSDGGDGFGEIISKLLRAKTRYVKTLNAAHEPCTSQWWWEPQSKTAIIEAARVVGLAMLPQRKFHPFELDTFGLGAVVHTAFAKGAKRCIIGIGGSATNDGGFGLARALGWEFFDRQGHSIERWTDLQALARIRPPKDRRRFKEVIVAADVQNPLLGTHGATRIFGPQKGLKTSDFARAETNLKKLARVVEGLDPRAKFHKRPGAGAAGGLGFGLLAFLDARLEFGFNLFAEFAELDSRLQHADLVITGEGCIDASTLMGKGTGQIASRCCKLKIPCIGLAGTVATGQRNRLFAELHGLTELTSRANALARAAHWLSQAAEKVASKV